LSQGFSRKVLPYALALGMAGNSFGFDIEGKLSINSKQNEVMPIGYHIVKDNKSGDDIKFDVYYSGEKFKVSMITNGKWSPWLVQAKNSGQEYILGRNDDNLN